MGKEILSRGHIRCNQFPVFDFMVFELVAVDIGRSHWRCSCPNWLRLSNDFENHFQTRQLDWRPREGLWRGRQRNSSHQNEGVRLHQICMRTERGKNNCGELRFLCVCVFLNSLDFLDWWNRCGKNCYVIESIFFVLNDVIVPMLIQGPLSTVQVLHTLSEKKKNEWILLRFFFILFTPRMIDKCVSPLMK